MGCGSSVNSKTRTSETLSQKQRVTSTNSIPRDMAISKDKPVFVEKVKDVMKNPEVEMATRTASDSKFENSTAEIISNDVLTDTDSGSSQQGYVQGFLADNDSVSLSAVINEEDEHFKTDDNSLAIFRDFDSLDTSSPESEIEEALANNIDFNPPTPKPTLSELENLYKLPPNNINSETISSTIQDYNTKINPVSKSTTTPVILSEPTEWEKQADVLATTRKYNPIEAMRKLKRESTRASSSLPHRDFRPRSQHYIEENLNDLFSSSTSNQSPLQSVISSAKSGRSGLTVPHVSDAEVSPVNMQNDRTNNKVPDIHIKKNISTPQKRKDSHLTVAKNTKIATSPSNFKVRERCAVCCNKYKT